MGIARKPKYDIFISYRRDGGADTAKHLRDSLAQHGYRVFLDVESLRSGPFNEQLYDIIDTATDFLLILPQGGLDRCESEGDWVRLEVERARERELNIIPIMLRGFSFPEHLPESIDFVRYQNGPEMTEATYWDAFVQRLEEQYLKSRRHEPWKRNLALAVSLALALAAGSGGYAHLRRYPHNNAQAGVVSSLISYLTLNLGTVDVASGQYRRELQYVAEYLQGSSSYSESELSLRLQAASDEIRSAEDDVCVPSDQLRSEIAEDGHFDLGELDAFQTYLVEQMEWYADCLDYLWRYTVPDADQRNSSKLAYVSMLQDMAELDGELIFYGLNETLLPVNDEDALADLKTTYLPELSNLYQSSLVLLDDRATIEGKEEAALNRYDKLMTSYGERMEDEEKRASDEMLLQRLDATIERMQAQGMDTIDLEERRDSLQQVMEERDKLRQELVQKSRELAEEKEALYEKFRPRETDDLDTLWGKGLKFLSVNMTDEAAECFDLYATRDEGDGRTAATAAKRYAEGCGELGISGGVVVFGYEEGMPRQDVQVGDIIYELNGQPVCDFGDYDAAVDGGTYVASVLRFSEQGYDLLEATIDTSLGRLALRGLAEERG